MAKFNQRPVDELAYAEELQIDGSVVALRSGIVASPAPSPARELQEVMARHTANDLYIADPAQRRVALVKFIGTAVLLWGMMAGAITAAMIAVR